MSPSTLVKAALQVILLNPLVEVEEMPNGTLRCRFGGDVQDIHNDHRDELQAACDAINEAAAQLKPSVTIE